MRVLAILCFLLFLTSCWDDDASFTFTPNQALEGQWEVHTGFFLWDNGNRISSINPIVDSLPSILLQFNEEGRYKVQYAFFVTNGFDKDTVTLTNGVQEGTFELMASEDQLLEYSGHMLLKENITNTIDEASIRYKLGSGVDSLWLEGVQLNSLLFGEISGTYYRNNR